MSWVTWLGGGLLVALVLSELFRRSQGWREAWKLKKAQKRASQLDWAVIDNSTRSRLERPKPDCERPESLGICTGLDCLVYESCDFNIKKVVH